MWGRSVLLLVILCAVCTAVEAMQRDGNSNTNGNSHSNTDSVDGPLRSLFDNSVSFLRKEIQQLFRDDSATVVSVTNSKDSSGVISINKEKTRNSADGSVNAYNSDDNYDSYYSTINPSATNEELKLQLQQLTYNHTVYTYDDVWIAFEEIDKYLYNYPCDADPAHIPDVYSAYCWETDKNVTTGGECGNYKKEGDCYNREHLWPKSWFGGKNYLVHESTAGIACVVIDGHCL